MLAWACAIAGLAAYNWWILALFKPGLIVSPNELFSDMEVTGQPFATLMQHADLVSGLLVGGAFLAIGLTALHDAGGEWAGMMVFALGGALGGRVPGNLLRRRQRGLSPPGVPIPAPRPSSTCTSSLASSSLAASPWPSSTPGAGHAKDETRTATIYRGLARAALVGYPILGAAYLVNRLGGIAEACFFVASRLSS